ncbi:hypothetical protein ACJJTC_003664 [Scirpophaga incertulas]
MNNVKEGDKVLILWNNNDQNEITTFVNELKNKKPGDVVLENSEMITEESRQHSSFDVVISNWMPPFQIQHTDTILALIVKLLKPNGKIVMKDETDITSALKLNGFVNINKRIKNNVYTAEKPSFEVGSKASIKFDSKAAVWKLDKTVEAQWNSAADDDDDIIDPDELLDENDFKKPDQQSLRVCATTGKRKACADCSCGLAEELRGEVKDTPKSSCGSCYLGDAFRCATCPYLGMPAFKPGEKVMLDLKSDI